MTPFMQEAQHILERELRLSPWAVEKPDAGNKDAVLATHGHRKVFLKFDVDGAALSRLAALGIAPALLAAGTIHDRAYVIQEYVEGHHPDRAWFSQHLPDLAQFIRRYHMDEELTRLVGRPHTLSYADYIRRRLERLDQGMQQARSAPLRTRHARDAFHRFVQQAQQLQHVPLVPTHADPNNMNFRLVGDRFFLLDWDDISLSDPLCDIGPLLWWYVPRAKWSVFFTAYGMAMDEAVVQKIYWWSACVSLGVAQWFDAHKQDGAGVDAFLLDWYGALNGQENPHGSLP